MKKVQLFYVGQKAFIDKNGEVLVLTLPNGWIDFPGGKIQEGETDFDTAFKREVQEETGLKIEIGELFHRWYFTFISPHKNAGKKVFLLGFKCKYISGDIKISDEHKGYRWVNKNNYQKLKEDRGHFKALEKYFSTESGGYRI